jgi:hypothetical protein
MSGEINSARNRIRIEQITVYLQQTKIKKWTTVKNLKNMLYSTWA